MPINIKDSIESSTIKGSLNGNASTATKATQDSAGQQINKTYIKGLSVSGKTITYTKGDGTTGTITTQDTNTTYSTGTASALGLTKLYTGTGTATDGTMTQNAINTALNGKANSSHGRHIPDACTSITDWNSATTNGWYMGVNATNAPTSGSNIWYFGEVVAHNTNYVMQTVYQFTVSTDAKAIPKYIRAKTNGTWGAWTNVTVAKAVPSNAVFTDTNTWRGVQDNLTSTAKDQSLSANQGKVLKGLVDGKANSSHTHNYAGSSSAGGAANSSNAINLINGRPTSANSGSIKGPNAVMMLSTSSMTTGKPVSDGYITEYRWDTDAGWSSQFFVPNTTNGKLQYRSMDAGKWGNWNTVYSTCNKPTPSEIGAASSGHTHNYAGSSSAGGNANAAVKLATARTINGTSFDGSANITTANWGTARNIYIASSDGSGASSAVSVNGSGNATLKLPATIKATLSGNASTATTSNYIASNTRMDYGWNGINYFNIEGKAGKAAKANDTPTSAWWHVMRFNHGNSAGFYTDLAIPFNDVSMYYKRITSGAVNNGGWVKILDALNYNNYAPTKTGGGASGTWGISVSGNATTATTLQTARTINGTSFNGSANITTANWGTARTLTIGNTGKSVNGSGNVSWSLSEIGAAAASHTHNYAASSHNHSQLVGINDTRETNFTPLSVPTHFKVTFQSSGTNGVTNTNGNYYSLMHIPKWNDRSGGYPYQLAFTDTDNIFFRRGVSDSSWETWRQIYHSGNYAPAPHWGTGNPSNSDGRPNGTVYYKYA